MIVNPERWSKKTLLSSNFILDALECHCFFAFKGVSVSRLLFLCMSKAAVGLPMFYLSLAAIWEVFLYQIL